MTDQEPGRAGAPLRADRAQRPRVPAHDPGLRARVRASRPGSRRARSGASTCSWRRRPPTSSTAPSPSDERASFDIVCERVPAGIQITVHDEGLPYDPSLTPEYDPGADLHEPDRRRPRQLPHAADRRHRRVPQPRQPRQGDGVRQVPRVASRHRRAAGRGERRSRSRSTCRRPSASSSTSARCARTQAIEVCRCIYDAYRYTYVNEHMYYPDRVVALNQSGDMVSAVASHARRRGGRARGPRLPGGHARGRRPGRGRHQGQVPRPVHRPAARRVPRRRRRSPAACTACSSKRSPSTRYTQKFCHRLGFADTRLPARLLAGDDGVRGHRRGGERAALRDRRLQVPDAAGAGACTRPARHRDVIAGIYERLGAPVTFGRERSRCPHRGLPQLDVSVNTSARWPRSASPGTGATSRERIRARGACGCCARTSAVIDVFLDLSTARHRTAWRRASRTPGFLFTGILPGGPLRRLAHPAVLQRRDRGLRRDRRSRTRSPATCSPTSAATTRTPC